MPQVLHRVYLETIPGTAARHSIAVPVFANDDVEATVKAKDEVRRYPPDNAPREGWKATKVVRMDW